ncbi:uncharacterized protein LOC114353325 isoform X4 [Ostrinia furnacalis]|uniref:uncharacterized protein LOC114353325 isoform X4 n=1 Tax=Ostrinia furnacalis TaxID=93504 RepID=UPI00103D4367|nr:uncharacterized protein LOC114353325 isoform X4 [Ostrinia furnacalis]
MSRKEHLKKSLGITEYPWSSDDEDPHMSEVNMLLRTTYENRTSVADMPGTSGLQQLPTLPTSPIIPVQRVQVKQERDLYWPLHTHTHTHTHTHAHAHKPIAGTHTCGARMLDIQPISQPFPMPMRSVIHTPAAELREVRPTPAENMQRLFAFKKLTKILPRQNRAANAGTATRATTTRNPVFASTSTPEVTHLTLTKNRAQLALKRLQNSRSTVSWDSHRCASARPEQVQASGGTRALRQSTAPAAGETRQLFTMPAAPPPPPPPPIPVVEIEDVPETNTTTPAAEAEVIADASDEPIDVEISNNSSNGGVSLEEEIVEIDAPDETEANATAEENNNNNNDNVVSSVVVLNEGAAATNEVDATDGLQSPERKRKREASNSFTAPEEGEPVTVKEFNQSLLRLLECPVCLEWMEPPMSQCRRGHLVCGRCRARLASCPVCRTTFSSVRNRAMEGVAEMVRYPCRHGCGREVRLRRRAAHEASCEARRYNCPAPGCADRAPLPRDSLHQHFQSKHPAMIKTGSKHKFSLKVNSEQHESWLVAALHEYFSLRVDADLRAWGVHVHVAYIGPKCHAKHYTYEVSIVGQNNSRKLSYTRATHSDLENYSLNVSSQDCFHLTIDQALAFLRIKNRHSEPDKFLVFHVEINEIDTENRDSDS